MGHKQAALPTEAGAMDLVRGCGHCHGMSEATPPELEGQPPEEAREHLNQMRVLVALMTLAGLWIARDFLLELAWAVTLAVALWPLYRRATHGRSKGRRILIPLGFTLGTGLVLMLPIVVVAVEAARDSQAALQWVTQAQKTGVPEPSWLPHIPMLGPRVAGWWHTHLADPRGASRLLGSVNASSVASWTEAI